MRYLHTMLRVRNLDAALKFYQDALGLKEVRRVDNDKAGWKGRGMWATYSSYLPKFTETRIGSVDHIQIRPSPLAN